MDQAQTLATRLALPVRDLDLLEQALTHSSWLHEHREVTRGHNERLEFLGDVVVSLATNDPDGSEPEFRKLLDQALAVVGPDRCLVWATIVRDGTTRTGFDRALQDARSANANLRLVEWARMIEQDRSLLAGDAVHGTQEGYGRRAADTARAIRTCPGR